MIERPNCKSGPAKQDAKNDKNDDANRRIWHRCHPWFTKGSRERGKEEYPKECPRGPGLPPIDAIDEECCDTDLNGTEQQH